jgi:magnesium chelatase family protein
VPCRCSTRQIEKHITVEVPPVPEREMQAKWQGTTLAEMRQQIAAKTAHQSLDLDEPSRNLLKAAVAELGIDAAGRQTVLQVARTIANLDGCQNIEARHLCDAINYRAFR